MTVPPESPKVDFGTDVINKTANYVGMDVDERTDLEKDDDIVNFVLEERDKGASFEDIYKLGKNPARTKGLVARYFRKVHPEASEFQIAEMAGATPAMAARENTDTYDDFMVGMGKTMATVGLGIRALTGFADESDEKVKGMLSEYDDNRVYMQQLTKEYDEDGSENIDLQQGEFFGEMAPMAVAAGVGGSITETAGGALAFDLGITSAETTLQTAAEGGMAWENYPTNLTVAALSSVAGSLLFPGGSNIKNTYNREQLETLSGGLKALSDMEVPLTQEMLNDPKVFKDTVEKASKNIWDKKGREAVLNLNADVVNYIKKIANSVGATPQQLADFRAGKLSAREIGRRFEDFVTKEAMTLQANVNVMHDSLKHLDLDEVGKPRTYSLGGVDSEGKLTGWLKELTTLASDNDTVYRYINRQIRHRGQLEGDESQAARAIINKHGEINANLSSAKKRTKVAADKLAVEETALRRLLGNENTADDILMRKRLQIKKLKEDLKSGKNDIDAYNKELGQSLISYKKLKEANREAWGDTDYSAAKLVEDFTSFTAEDMKELEKSINHKINVGGGAISTDDREQMALLNKLKSNIRSKMKSTIEDPAYLDTLKEANKLTVAKYNLISDAGGIKGLKAAMESSNPADFTALFTSDKEGVNNLFHLKQLNGGEYTKEYNMMLNKVYSGKVLDGVEEVGGYNLNLNYEKLRDNVNDEDFIADLSELASPEVVENFKALKGLVNAYGQVFQEIARNQPQIAGTDKGWAAKLGEFMQFIKTPGDGLNEARKRMAAPAYDAVKKKLGSQDRMYWYDEKANFSDAINDLFKRMKEEPTPEGKKALMDMTITEFTKEMLGKSKMRPAHLSPFPTDSNVKTAIGKEANEVLDSIKGIDTQWIKRAMSHDNIDEAIKRIDSASNKVIGKEADKLQELKTKLLKYDNAPVNNVGGK